jgi:hypothetical protein
MSAPITLQLNQQEFDLLTHAVRSLMSDFGHDEADVINQLRALLAKMAAASSAGVPS